MSLGIHSLPFRGSGGGGGSTPPPVTRYVQDFAVPDTTWTVHHSLGTTTPTVELYGEDGHSLGDPDDVYVPDSSTVIVTWAVPVAGKAVIGS
jgi:hypothetical protein